MVFYAVDIGEIIEAVDLATCTVSRQDRNGYKGTFFECKCKPVMNTICVVLLRKCILILHYLACQTN